MTDGAQTNPVGAALLALQELDLHLDQLVYRRAHLPARLARDELGARRAALRRDRESIDAQRSGFVARQNELERAIAEAEVRLAQLEARASGGSVGSFRDQEAVATEISAVGRRKHDLEDEALEVMEALEPHDAAVASVEAEAGALDEQEESLRSTIAEDEAVIAAEITELTARRGDLASVVPEALRAEYERLRARLSGIGAAKLVHGTCSGCNMKLPATELDRIRHLPEGMLEHCEQCGRLLVP